MSDKYVCPIPGCGEVAKYVSFECEEVGVPHGMTIGQLPKTKKGSPLSPVGVQRNVLVECPTHGRKIWRHIGHHVSVKGA